MAKKSRYSLWGPQPDSYGVTRWGINDTQHIHGAGAYNISGNGFLFRKEAVQELQKLRAKERADKEQR